MKRLTVVILVIGFFVSVSWAAENGACNDKNPNQHALTREQIAQIRSMTEQRRLGFFSKESGKPLERGTIINDWNGRGDFTRHYAQSIVLFAMRACELNEQLEEANAAIQELCQYHLERRQTFLEIHSFPGVTDALARLYIFYGPRGTKVQGQLSAPTSAILEKTMWEWANEKSTMKDAELEQSQTWWIEYSENHHAQHFSTCWVFSGILKDVPVYQDKRFKDGYLPGEHYAVWTAYLKEYLRQRACKGMFVEIHSPSYATATLKSIYNLFDFSEDPVLKKRAGQLIDLYWMLWAQEQIVAVEGGAKARCYPGHALKSGGFMQSMAWYIIGMGNPEFVHCAMLPFITSTWSVPDRVLQLAYNRQSFDPYEIRQRRMGLAVKGYDRPDHYRLNTGSGGILRYSYCTPDYIMGSLITEARPTEDWVAISSQNRWAGVIFEGDSDARVFPAAYNDKGNSVMNGFWSVQSKGTMISRQMNSRYTRKGETQEWRVFFSSAGLSDPVQDGSWFFAEAKNAYVGVYVVQDSSYFEQSSRGHWLVCKNTMTPVIIEAGRKSDYADFSTFQKRAMAQALSYEDSILTYQTLSGDELTFYCDQSDLPEINGVTVNLTPELVFDSPFVQSQWDSGMVTIKYGQDRKILNFNEQ